MTAEYVRGRRIVWTLACLVAAPPVISLAAALITGRDIPITGWIRGAV
jgi:hypothetical protein